MLPSQHRSLKHFMKMLNTDKIWAMSSTHVLRIYVLAAKISIFSNVKFKNTYIYSLFSLRIVSFSSNLSTRIWSSWTIITSWNIFNKMKKSCVQKWWGKIPLFVLKTGIFFLILYPHCERHFSSITSLE